MAFDYLVDHALKNVWCTPNQDMQSIMKPARLTPLNGVWNNAEVNWRKIKLPVPGKRFHVYQIGQLHPNLIGLFQSDRVWSTMTSVCNQEKMIVDIYNDAGIQMPRSECWFMVTADKNLILAIKEQATIPIDLRVEDIFMRVYSNAYFASKESDPQDDFIEVGGGYVADNAAILAIQNRMNQLALKPGAVYGFVNGRKVLLIDLISAKPGDIAEYVYDSSILRIVDFPVSSLQTFNSILDNKHKYLLHYPGNGSGTIDYQDDIDVFLVKPRLNGRHIGVYWHRNQIDSLRMLSHKDYSVPVAYLTALAGEQADWDDPEELVIRLHIRKSGYHRTLFDENNRIKELYKLPDAQVLAAMVGLESSVECWAAATLENSMYVDLMRRPLMSITREMVQDAYGYNALSKLVGDTPKLARQISGDNGVDVPHGLYRDSMAYEYDINGKLLGFNSHDFGSIFYAYYPETSLVEMIAGYGDEALDEYYGQMTQTLNPAAEYRMYVCPIVLGSPSNVWQDVTGSGMYARIGNQLTWLIDPDEYYPMVRSNLNFLAYDVRMQPTDGLLRISLTSLQTRNSTSNIRVMQVPMGELDIWLNGHSLIENVDYFVKFPEVIIVSKKYLQNADTQEQLITIRSTGFCDNLLNRNVSKEVGFVRHGLLSHNNRYDIRDDKVMRIVVGGKTKHRSQLKFSETDAAVIVPDASNGSPYMLRDIVVPLRGIAVEDTYELRDRAVLIDDQISDYLTLKIPENHNHGPNVIQQLYQVFSPFCCKLIYDLKSGVLTDPRLVQSYTDEDVLDICSSYEFLLDFDPTQDELRLDPDYVIVHPHNLTTVIDVNIYQYKFMNRVVRLYLNNRVELSHFLRLSA